MLPAASRAAFGAALTVTHVCVNSSARDSSCQALNAQRRTVGQHGTSVGEASARKSRPAPGSHRRDRPAHESSHRAHSLLACTLSRSLARRSEPRRGRTQDLRLRVETAATDLSRDWTIRDRRTVHRNASAAAAAPLRPNGHPSVRRQALKRPSTRLVSPPWLSNGGRSSMLLPSHTCMSSPAS